MELSKGERLILSMLTDIYQAMGLTNVDAGLVKEAIGSGNLWALEWELPGVFVQEDIPEDLASEVVDILDMWSFIEEAYESLSAADKQDLEQKAVPFGRKPRFAGFDGNNEQEHMSAARMLIKHMGRFPIFQGRDLNSHTRSVDGYRRMFEAFKPMRPSLGEKQLGVDALAEILMARVHPDNR